MRFDQIQISHKYGIGSLEMENKLVIQFWCCPKMGHLYPIFNPHCGAFAAFPKQDDQYSTNARGGGGGRNGHALNLLSH